MISVSGSNIATSAKMLASISPPIGFGLGAVCIFQFEATGSGIQRNNVNVKSDNISYNDVRRDFWCECSHTPLPTPRTHLTHHFAAVYLILLHFFV